MSDDGTRWTVHRFDVVRALLFLAGALTSATVAVLLPAVAGDRSGRVATLQLTFGCLAAGALLGFVLAVGVLVGRSRVEGDDPVGEPAGSAPVGATSSS